ncbi:MAG: pyruvate, water dikinase regulatory protein [Planctomycetota bacterium]
MQASANQPDGEAPPLFIVSGGAGASGEQLVQTVLVQFPDARVDVRKVAHVRHRGQIANAVARAAEEGATIVHTLVDAELRRVLTEVAESRGVPHIDLMGALMDRLAAVLDTEPVGRAGLYRQLHSAYFERVEAIEFAMLEDDGKNPEGWSSADVVLVGVSRVGKTPLSMYLSVLGWKVANVPIVRGLPVPDAVFTLDRKRLIGLHMDASQLLQHRRERVKSLGSVAPGYAEPEAVYDEADFARALFRRNGMSIIDVTNKPIETSADEVIALITRRFSRESKDAPEGRA